MHVENFVQLITSFFYKISAISDENINAKEIEKQFLVTTKTFNILTLLKGVKKIKKIIETERPDIIHIQQINRLAYFTILSLQLSKLKTPIVTTAWGSDVLLMPQQNFIYKHMVTYVLKNSNYCTADSQQMISAIKKLVPTVPIKQVLFGINPIKPSVKEKIIYSNRLHHPLYNIDKIIDEFYTFQKKHTDWRLIIGATGSLTNQLKEKVRGMNLERQVEFIGWVTSSINNQYYSKAHIYISIPNSDGTAVSLLEAMSAGCVPVVSNLKVSKEWIKDNKSGVLFKENEENFEKALALNQSDVASINNAVILSKATKNIASQKYNEIYNSIIC